MIIAASPHSEPAIHSPHRGLGRGLYIEAQTIMAHYQHVLAHACTVGQIIHKHEIALYVCSGSGENPGHWNFIFPTIINNSLVLK